jgi:arsenical pump membrane protein
MPKADMSGELGFFRRVPSGPVASTASVVLLVAVLALAVARPYGLSEAAAAVPAAAVAVAAGLLSPAAALGEIRALAPTIGFLAAVLALAHRCDAEGVFAWAGDVMARRAGGSPQRLLGTVFVTATLTTAVLSLDATVVLLTPVVLATTHLLRVRARPHVYACAHLANSASLLLPVSNLTNLLAFGRSGLGFGDFALRMALPSAVVVGIEYLVFRRRYAADLGGVAQPVATRYQPPPVFALAVVGATLAGFAATKPLGVEPVWVAAAGALVLAVRQVARTPAKGRWRTTGRLLAETNPLFCAFVPALAVVVAAVSTHGLGDVLRSLLPTQPTLGGLLGATVLAAVLANVVNNLPATLLLLPVVPASPPLVLAILLGVNVGPNLTYVGSLATLLWRRIPGVAPSAAEFTWLGLLTVPACLVGGALALWASVAVLG